MDGAGLYNGMFLLQESKSFLTLVNYPVREKYSKGGIIKTGSLTFQEKRLILLSFKNGIIFRSREILDMKMEYSRKAVKYINSVATPAKQRLKEAIEKIPAGNIKNCRGLIIATG